MIIDNFSKYEFYHDGKVFAKNRGLFLKGSYKPRSGIHYYNISNDQNEKVLLTSDSIKIICNELVTEISSGN